MSIHYRAAYEDESLSLLYRSASDKAQQNLRFFGERKVLVEGAGYEKIWLQTQPMGGEMYFFRDPVAALNNTLLFMETQRQDGRLPGSIQCVQDGIVPQFNKLQGFCFARPALRLYYLNGQDRDYLLALRKCLSSFDAWLHRTRDLWQNGILASYCVYDTGDDNAVRYGDAPVYHTQDAPPQGYEYVPMMSMDITGYSYACREVLGEIGAILGDEAQKQKWARAAQETRGAMRRMLWDEKQHAYFDRFKDGRVNPVLCHSTIRCMYYGVPEQKDAQAFITHRLLDPQTFFTPCPVPSTAVNDPLFRNIPGNNWSGQSQGLTWQRLLEALQRYGRQDLLPLFAQKIHHTILKNDCCFYQQYDPFTAMHGEGSDCYGPAILSVLRAFDTTRGISSDGQHILFSAVASSAFECELDWQEEHYSLRCDGRKAEGMLNGRKLFSVDAGTRITVDRKGNITGKFRFSCE